jgi:hypothetical protein
MRSNKMTADSVVAMPASCVCESADGRITIWLPRDRDDPILRINEGHDLAIEIPFRSAALGRLLRELAADFPLSVEVEYVDNPAFHGTLVSVLLGSIPIIGYSPDVETGRDAATLMAVVPTLRAVAMGEAVVAAELKNKTLGTQTSGGLVK